MIKTKRKTIEQQIAEVVSKLSILKTKQKKMAKTKAELSIESDGMRQLLELVMSVAKTNKSKISDVVIAIAKIKKTQLKIESNKRKPKQVD